MGVENGLTFRMISHRWQSQRPQTTALLKGTCSAIDSEQEPKRHALHWPVGVDGFLHP